jgi:hypothetical protein
MHDDEPRSDRSPDDRPGQADGGPIADLRDDAAWVAARVVEVAWEGVEVGDGLREAVIEHLRLKPMPAPGNGSRSARDVSVGQSPGAVGKKKEWARHDGIRGLIPLGGCGASTKV